MKIFIDNLPKDTSRDQLEELFAPYGKVSGVIFSRSFTGEFTGVALVEMEDEDNARAAIAALHGRQWQGHTLHVDETAERDALGSRGADKRSKRW